MGTRYADFTVKVPDTVRPTCTLTLTDVSGTEDIYGSPVQGLSKMKISVNATSAYSSPIESYSIKANGETHTTQEATTSALKGDGSTPVTVTVTDKRGRTGSTYHIMNVLAYTRPSIMFRKGRIEEEEYDRDYYALEKELKQLEALVEKPEERDLEGLKGLLETDYRTLYNELDKEHRKAFWRNIIKEFSMGEDRKVDPESIIFF